MPSLLKISLRFSIIAKMIGVIAEYGAGKTSLTELMARKHKSKVVRINLWDTLSEEHAGNPNEINHLTKAFIYQLAMGKSSYRAEHVNKILSNNIFLLLSKKRQRCSYFRFYIVCYP